MVKIFCIHNRYENVENVIDYRILCTVILKYHKTYGKGIMVRLRVSYSQNLHK